MPSIQIKDVPDQTHAVLRQRASAAHQSLQEYLRAKLIAEAARPTVDEVLKRASDGLTLDDFYRGLWARPHSADAAAVIFADACHADTIALQAERPLPEIGRTYDDGLPRIFFRLRAVGLRARAQHGTCTARPPDPSRRGLRRRDESIDIALVQEAGLRTADDRTPR